MKSAPSTISGFSGDFDSRHGNVSTGRMLANRPSFLRMARSPCSGRTLALGSLSYFGSPTAENSTASHSSQSLKVRSGNGSPRASMAAAPAIPYLNSTVWPNRSHTAFITLTPCTDISGPIPSPGKTAITKFITMAFILYISAISFLFKLLDIFFL